jgi:YegS/Rv2252/BmrU family lipid kinase
MPRAILIYNPTAGRQNQRDWLPEILPVCRRAGFRIEAQETSGPGTATEWARGAAGSGTDLVIAWGGDGTVNEVANGLAGTEVALGILPGGSVNVLALELGIPQDLHGALDLLVRSGHRRRMGLGRIGERYFLLMAGIGLDAWLIRQVPAEQKRALGSSAYVLAALWSSWTYRFPPLSVQFDGKSVVGRQAVFSNIPRYGGSLRVAPLADPFHPCLNLFLFQGRRPWNYVRYLYGVRKGHHSVYRDVLNFQWNRFRVPAGAVAVGVQVDGEYLGETPVEIDKVPDALTVISPKP